MIDMHAHWRPAEVADALRARTKEPLAGRIERDPAGNPTGTLRDQAADFALRAKPTPGLDFQASGLDKAFDAMRATGITSVQDAAVDGRVLEADPSEDGVGGGEQLVRVPSHIAHKATSARSIGKTAPISGSIPARAIRLIIFCMSSSVPMMEPVMVSWLLIIGRRFSDTSMPVVPPVATSVPPRASDDILCAQVAEPMLSTIADTLRGRDSLEEKVWCAPSALACARPSSVRLVTQTSKPAARPS